jgi:Myb-like DNA-binding domain
MDGKCEWVVVLPRPFRRYIENYSSDTPAMTSFLDEQSDFGSFDDEESEGSIDDHAATSRRLYYGYAAGRGGRNTTTIVSSPQRVVVTTASSYQPYSESRPQSGASIASSLSLSTLGTPSPFATPDSKRSSPSTRREGGEFSPKYSQKLWTPEEDRLLLNAVAGVNESNLKWSLVARAVPSRSGKQCRERYLNHLTPNIKLKNWSPVEDAIIFRLYHTDGSKWSMMSKLIRGRTDNGIKNRYHHLKRRFERQVELTQESQDLLSTMARLTEVPLIRRFESCMIKYAASEILGPSNEMEASEVDGYLRVGCNELCSRCGMLVPSIQTGSLVCKTTGWCEVCVRVSPCISGEILRAVCEARVPSTVATTR